MTEAFAQMQEATATHDAVWQRYAKHSQRLDAGFEFREELQAYVLERDALLPELEHARQHREAMNELWTQSFGTWLAMLNPDVD